MIYVQVLRFQQKILRKLLMKYLRRIRLQSLNYAIEQMVFVQFFRLMDSNSIIIMFTFVLNYWSAQINNFWCLDLYVTSWWVTWARAKEASMGWCKSCQGNVYYPNIICWMANLLLQVLLTLFCCFHFFLSCSNLLMQNYMSYWVIKQKQIMKSLPKRRKRNLLK